jgi:hypothetical protein
MYDPSVCGIQKRNEHMRHHNDDPHYSSRLLGPNEIPCAPSSCRSSTEQVKQMTDTQNNARQSANQYAPLNTQPGIRIHEMRENRNSIR